jgi:hypothetical protein
MNKETLTVETDEYGTIWYYNADDQLHNPNGPAVSYSDGDKYHYINGELHNPNGPALIWENGQHKEYYIKGQRHNPNGPAIIRPDGSKSHYINGQLHNPNGPAVIGSDGGKWHYINGNLLTEAKFKAWQVEQSAPLHNETATIDGIEYTLTAK